MNEELRMRLDYLLRHIENVRASCELLGRRLIETGEESVGLQLIANGQIHDASKFKGVEWDCLNDNRWPRPDPDPRAEHFTAALRQHVTTNPHHPEYWGKIDLMPRVYLAEMLCDWKSRSAEQGTDVMEWVSGPAAERFGYSTKGRVYKELRGLAELLLERRFK